MELTVKGEAACSTCGQNEYLPSKCPHCEKLFCAKHRESHEGCDLSPATASSAPVSAYRFSCFVCSKAVPVELICPLCRNVCCTDHRDATAHRCSAVTAKAEEAKALMPAAPKPVASAPTVPKAVGSTGLLGAPEDPEKKAKNDALRRKVALTKLKVKAPAAKGIAVEDQLFLESEYYSSIAAGSTSIAGAGAGSGSAAGPSPGSQQQYHCVSSRTTTVAQLLDVVAAAHKAVNKNSSETDSNNRLHLYVKEPAVTSAAALLSSLESADGKSDETSASSPLACRLLPDSSLKALVTAGTLSSGDTVVLLKGSFKTRGKAS